MNKKYRWLTTLIFLMTMFACVLPGQQPASLPTVTPDTRLEIMLAETVSAALTQTQQAVPTETPPPTSTPEPTATSTPQADSSGSTLIQSDDGSVIFIDERAKYQIIVPSELKALRINQQEFLDAWLLPEASNPAIQRTLGNIQNQDPNGYRLFVVDFNEEHIDGGFVTNINIVWDEAEEISLEDETEIVAVANSYPTELPGSEVLTTEITRLENGRTIGVITSRLPATTLDDVDVVVFQKQIIIDLPVGTLSVTLSTTETWQATIEPLFDEMLETFNFVF